MDLLVKHGFLEMRQMKQMVMGGMRIHPSWRPLEVKMRMLSMWVLHPFLVCYRLIQLQEVPFLVVVHI